MNSKLLVGGLGVRGATTERDRLDFHRATTKHVLMLASARKTLCVREALLYDSARWLGVEQRYNANLLHTRCTYYIYDMCTICIYIYIYIYYTYAHTLSHTFTAIPARPRGRGRGGEMSRERPARRDICILLYT